MLLETKGVQEVVQRFESGFLRDDSVPVSKAQKSFKVAKRNSLNAVQQSIFSWALRK